MKTIGLGALAVSLIFLVTLVLVVPTVSRAADAPLITKEELKARLGSPDLVIVDVRTAHDWEGSDSMIKGAVRENPTGFGRWMDKYPKEKTLVFY